MSQALECALEGEAWSLSAIVFDLEDIFDDEGRPVAERRARALTRSGVPMDMRACPYHDLREGKLMNHSALTQVSRHYNAVMPELAAFRSQCAEPGNDWASIVAAVTAQLARPALHLLEHRPPDRRVPAADAVAHKLGAGFFGVLLSALERKAQGLEIQATPGTFLSITAETRALIGANEVCAGSPAMIRNAVETLFAGDPAAPALPERRLEVARGLALQVELGVFWRLYDRYHYRALLTGPDREQLRPFNHYLQGVIEQESRAVAERTAPPPSPAHLPPLPDTRLRSALAQALAQEGMTDALRQEREVLECLLAEPGAVVAYTGDQAAMAEKAARYALTYRLFRSAIAVQEQRIRHALGFPGDTPFAPGPLVFMPPKTLPWLERILGIRMGESGYFDGSRLGVRQMNARL